MPRYWRNKAVLAKVETTYGTDAVPTGAANAMLASNVKLTPLDAEFVDRSYDMPYLGKAPKVAVAQKAKLSFEVELAGSGTAGTAPAWAPLLRGCGMAETIVASTSAAYNPISAAQDSLTLYLNVDGKNHKLLGARGSWSVKLDAKQIPMLSFEFTGLWTLATDTVLPTLTTTAWKAPLAVNNTNTPTASFSVHGYSSKLYSLNLNIGNQVVYRNLPGAEDVLITDRDPGGDITIEDPTMSAKDFFTVIKAGTVGLLTVTHGTVGGAKIKIDAQVQLLNPDYDQINGVVVLKMGLEPTPLAGNDEIVITNL